MVIWKIDPFHLMNFNDIGDVVRNVHVDDTNEILWIDPGDLDEPVLAYDDSEMFGKSEPISTLFRS